MGEPVWDEFAERAALGLAIQFPESVGREFCRLGDVWYSPAHKELAGVLSGMLRSGQSVDTATVFGQLQAQGLTRNWDVVKVFNLTQNAYRPESLHQFASRLRRLSGIRTLSVACQRATQRLESVSEFEDESDIRAATQELRQACETAEAAESDVDMPAPTAMGDFLGQEFKRQWLVPGLLERMDRTVITGAEGGGKSVLCSQMAATLAGGVHPFGGNVMGNGNNGVRVLVIDCENSPAQSQRRYRWVIDRVDEVRSVAGFDPVDWNTQMQIDMKPKGVDLLGGRDMAWIEHAIQACAPDLLVLGPLYKLHRGEPSDEVMARDLAWALDGLRERYGFALLTEAHAGHSKDQGTGKRIMRPIGSSLWLRWPEFGFGLSRATDDPGLGRAQRVDVVSWRGSREERAWPDKLAHGATLPWLPDADYFATMNDYE